MIIAIKSSKYFSVSVLCCGVTMNILLVVEVMICIH